MWIHTVLLVRYGGASGVRDKGSLEAALARPYTAFGGKKSFPSFPAKAAALMQSVIQRHPFMDGNKRTGTAGAIYLLAKSGYRIKRADNAAIIELALSVANHGRDLEELTLWFEQHSEQTPESE